MDEHRELVALIESNRHLLIGAKAMAAYVDQRFTADTDYLVGHKTFLKVRRWLGERSLNTSAPRIFFFICEICAICGLFVTVHGFAGISEGMGWPRR